jgi:AcrR family transcriptional regulator
VTEPANRNRETTRARLLDAARRLFLSMDYGDITIERIAKAAGFTRAAFYLHFSTKDEVLAAWMTLDSHEGDALFRWFETRPPTRENIDRFVRRFVGNFQRSPMPGLFHSVAQRSDAARAALHQNRLRQMALMGESFPAMRPRRDDSPAELARAGRALLLVFQLEQLGLRREETADPLLMEQMVNDVVDQLAGFTSGDPAGA